MALSAFNVNISKRFSFKIKRFNSQEICQTNNCVLTFRIIIHPGCIKFMAFIFIFFAFLSRMFFLLNSIGGV